MPPACDQMKRISGKRAASPLNATPMMARVVSVPYSMLPGATRRVIEIPAAVGRRRVHVDDGLAAIELLHHRPERRVAQPHVAVAREQADAVGLQRVVGVGDLLRAWRRRRAAASPRTGRTASGDPAPASRRTRCTRARDGAVTAASPNHRPGLVIDTIAAATPPRSMSSIDFAGVQVVFAGCSSGRPLTSVTHAGGAK